MGVGEKKTLNGTDISGAPRGRTGRRRRVPHSRRRSDMCVSRTGWHIATIRRARAPSALVSSSYTPPPVSSSQQTDAHVSLASASYRTGWRFRPSFVLFNFFPHSFSIKFRFAFSLVDRHRGRENP